MALKFKLVLILACCVVLVLGIYYVVGKLDDSAIAKAKAEVEALKGDLTALTSEKNVAEKNLRVKETEYQQKVIALNGRLMKLQREKDGLESELAKLKHERESIVIPSDPARLCDEFVAAGFRSCTSVKRADVLRP